MRKAVAINTVSQLIGRGVSAVTTLVVTVIVARTLGVTGYGDFVKATTYVAFFYLLADFGINAVFLQHNEQEYWASLVSIRVVVGTLLVLVALGIVALLPGTAAQGYTPVTRLAILLLSPTILLQGLITSANAIFQRRLRYDFATWAIFFGSLTTVGTLIVSRSAGLLMTVGAVAAGTFVTALTSLLFAQISVKPQHFVATMSRIRHLLVPSVPLAMTLFFNIVYFRADSIILTFTRTTAEVGLYGLAYKVFEVLLVFPTFFMNAVYPLLLEKKQEREKIFQTSFFFLLAVSLIAVPAVWVSSPLVAWIKTDFSQSVGALRILSLGLPFFFTTAATMWMLIAKKMQTALLWIYGFSMIVNLIGNLLFIPRYGYTAAAWMTVAGEGVVLLLSLYEINRSH